MEFKQLRYFVRIVDLGSFSRAGVALHIAQSALSQHVAALEDEMKTMLLHRTTRGVQPTEAGRLFYQHAQLILQNAADAKAVVEACSAQPSGQVAMGLPLSIAPGLGIALFKAVRRDYPAIRLQILEELSGTILEWVANGRLTLGIAFDDDNLSGLHTIPLMEERLFLILSPNSPLAGRKRVTVRELSAMNLVMPTTGQGVRSRIDKVLADAGFSQANIAAEIDSLTIMKQAAAAEIGPTILSWMSVEQEVARGELVALEITTPPVTRVAHLCMLPASLRSRAVQAAAESMLGTARDAVREPSRRGLRFLAGEHA